MSNIRKTYAATLAAGWLKEEYDIDVSPEYVLPYLSEFYEWETEHKRFCDVPKHLHQYMDWLKMYDDMTYSDDIALFYTPTDDMSKAEFFGSGLEEMGYPLDNTMWVLEKCFVDNVCEDKEKGIPWDGIGDDERAIAAENRVE